MMKYAIAALAVLALLAAACGGDAARAPSTPEGTPPPRSSLATRQAPPRLVNPLPEGVLVVQQEFVGDQPSSPVYTVSSDGSVRRIGESHSVVTSPDGVYLALLRGGTARRNPEPNLAAEVRVLAADGAVAFTARGGEQTSVAGNSFPWAVWSPDGFRLAYTLPDARVPALAHVYIVQRGSWQARRVTLTAGYYSPVGWALDGSLIIGQSQGEGGRLLLAGSPMGELSVPQAAFQFWSFTPSPDGRRLAFYSGSWEAMEVWTLDLESGESRLVAHAGGSVRRPGSGLYASARAPGRAQAEAPAPALLKGPPPLTWSPDGTRLAYETGRRGNDGWTSLLHIVDLVSGRDTVVSERPGGIVAWSPDGRYLATLADGEVVLFGPDGTTRHTGVTLEGSLLWSGDGTLFVISGGASGMSLIDPDTGGVREATESGEQVRGAFLCCGEPVWSPSGRYLAFATSPESHPLARRSVAVLHTATGEATRILGGGGYWVVGWMGEPQESAHFRRGPLPE